MDASLPSQSEWRFRTWNPMTGCVKVSPGCDNCYAERIALRLQRDESPRYRNGFDLTLHDDLLTQPLRWKQPSIVFSSSMSDLFHADVPDSFLERMFQTMNAANWHVFHLLTKRPRRLARFASRVRWSSNIWAGVTVERADYTWRIRYLREVPARVRFLSVEPLLGPIPNLPLEGVDWVLVGGEAGPNARPMKPEWARVIRDQCLDAGVSFVFKQWGGSDRRRGGRILDGRMWDGMPPLPSTHRELQMTAF